MSISRRQAIKTLGAIAAGGISSLFFLQSAHAVSGETWFRPSTTALTRYLVFDIQTGDDDLRSESIFNIGVGRRSLYSATTWTKIGNGGVGWGNWSWHRLLVDFGSWIPVEDVQILEFDFYTGYPPFATADNWNLQNLYLHSLNNYFGPPPNPYVLNLSYFPLLYTGQGNPFYRFQTYDFVSTTSWFPPSK